MVTCFAAVSRKPDSVQEGTMALNFFDCNCMVGHFAVPQPGSFFTVDELLAEMDYCGIARALVYHTWALGYSPAAGNRRLLDEIAGRDRLLPCWVVMPHHTGEMSPPDELIAEMKRHGVRAVRIFPASKFHHWSLSDWSAGPLLSALAAQRVPLFVGFDQITWDTIHRLGTTYPDLPTIVTEVRYEEWRHIYPLLDQLPNLHIELSWMVVHYGLEAAVERFGPARFLFGSRMPIFSAGPALCHINYADLDEEDKALIAGDNLRRLLDW
jgi:predicted TIM-barrel fold metal-dependent hydrolase